MTGKRRSVLRLIVAAAFVVPTVVLSVSTSSSAAPSKQEVEAAHAKLDALNRQLDQLIELYNQAQIRLQQSEAQLAETQHAKRHAEAEAARSMSDLSDRAVAAYTGMGSQLDVLLGADSFTEFSDRLQFMGALAQSDADLAVLAETAGQQAKWAAGKYAEAVAARQANLDELTSRKDDISTGIADQQALYEKLNKSYEGALAAQAAAEAAASAGGSGGSGGGDWGGFVPPPNASAAQIAIAAAESVIGTQYVWGSADPNVGFDCSGLVMWSYAQAGVYLPHSSAMMSEMLPSLTQSELVAGDLLFFYTPVSHVSIYLGGGSMIDASHPGPGGEVNIQPVYWQYFRWGGRIG
jgi:cell wall-associated NlpC family hydrolase